VRENTFRLECEGVRSITGGLGGGLELGEGLGVLEGAWMYILYFGEVLKGEVVDVVEEEGRILLSTPLPVRSWAC
jgi:hypothetical protein